ncbi:hypothetical protein PUMCH_004119 [Australozyma saopauloensis]|uniref:RRM domain-containing protein n=1 Tax=Australozyma saopauloensis TaxID=291208 RepID=A0AAX4HED3_9ASCO|nr:hypothetical protein PUMCH_004119 [[Candida] saopauloensis]
MTFSLEEYGSVEQKPYTLLAPINPTIVSSTASQQHQHEQEMLLLFAVPEPPISTKELTYASENDPHKNPDSPPSESPRTLWMGDLDPWLDQSAIEELWWKILNKRVTVKLIKPKLAKQEVEYMGQTHSGYCFVEFDLFEDAQEALALNGQLLPDIAIPSQLNGMNDPNNQKKYFRLNWASGATLSAPIVDSPEFSLFVGDLSALTTEAHLLLFFQKAFPDSVRTVRVMTDPITGKSRCFGFVRFTDELERQRALVEMNGAWFGGRPLRVALATSRNNAARRNQEFKLFPPQLGYMGGPVGPVMGGPPHYDASLAGLVNFPVPPPAADPMMGPAMGGPPQDFMYIPQGPPGSMPYAVNMNTQFSDPTNTTVFVGGLLHEVSEHTLFTLFKHFGQILQIKIPAGKNCGFIKFNTREDAEEAILAMEGYVIGGHRVRLGWGRVSANNKRFYQRRQHQMHVQMQAAAAMSIGMDPASAYAAVAAGFPSPPQSSPGYPHMPMQLPPQVHGMMPYSGGGNRGMDMYIPGEEDVSGDYNGHEYAQEQFMYNPGAEDPLISGLSNLSIGAQQGEPAEEKETRSTDDSPSESATDSASKDDGTPKDKKNEKE